MTSFLKTLMVRIGAMFFRRGEDAEFSDELREHLDMLTEENVRRGMPLAEARREAKIRLGGAAQLRETHRELTGIPFLETLVQDIRYALRMLRKNPGFTAVAVLTLALGIGANTAIFSAAYSILLRPLPYQDPNRLVVVTVLAPGDDPNGGAELSLPAIDKIKSRTHVFDEVIAVDSQNCRLTNSGTPEMLQTGIVSGNYFQVLGIQPLRGRTILPSDGGPSSAHVVVLSYPFWQKHFRGDPAIVGKQIDLVDGYAQSATPASYAVVGVAPPFFLSPGYGWDYDIWIPEKPRSREYSYLGGNIFAVARLRSGVSVEEANHQLHALSLALGQQYSDDKGWELRAQPLQERIVHKSRLALLVLLGAVGFLLLIACVNVSNLFLTRAWGRLREVAVREALGATRLRVVRQLLTETILLALLGCAFGLFLGYLGIDILRANAPEGTPRVNEIGLYAPVFWYAFGISVAAGIAFGLGPALQVSARNLLDVLKGSRAILPLANAKRRPARYANFLIVSEVALAVVLLVGSVLMIRSFDKLVTVPLGFHTDHILSMSVQLDPSACKDKTQCLAAFDQMLARIRALPGVQSAALASYPPLEGGGILTTIFFEGEPPLVPGQVAPSTKEIEVSPSYFSLLGIPMLKGHDFALSDSQNAPPVAIVNQAFARKFLSGENSGKHFWLGGIDKKRYPLGLSVIGTVSDTRDNNPAQPATPEIYIPFTQQQFSLFNSADLLVRTAIDPDTLAPAIRERIWAVSKNAPIGDVQTMDQIAARAVAEPKFQTFLLASFGVLGLLLAVVGIYGVISYSVSQRTHEIGVRLALGAEPKHILRFVVGNTMLLTFAGIAIGIASSFALSSFLRSLLFEVKPTDPLSFIFVTLLFFLVALAACWIPARRAMRVDPMVALRYE